jgi:hypothetical protein
VSVLVVSDASARHDTTCVAREQFYQERAGQGSAELLFDSHASRARDSRPAEKDKSKDITGAKSPDVAPSPLKVRVPACRRLRLRVSRFVQFSADTVHSDSRDSCLPRYVVARRLLHARNARTHRNCRRRWAR